MFSISCCASTAQSRHSGVNVSPRMAASDLGVQMEWREFARGVFRRHPGSAPTLGAHKPALSALLVLTTSRRNNTLGSLLFARLGLRTSRSAQHRQAADHARV